MRDRMTVRVIVQAAPVSHGKVTLTTVTNSRSKRSVR